MSKNYNASLPLLDFYGQPVKEGEKELTFGDVIVMSLMVNSQDDAKISVTEKLQRFSIAQRAASCLMDKTKLRLEDNEIEIVLACANKILTIYSLGKLHEFFKSCILSETFEGAKA